MAQGLIELIEYTPDLIVQLCFESDTVQLIPTYDTRAYTTRTAVPSVHNHSVSTAGMFSESS